MKLTYTIRGRSSIMRSLDHDHFMVGCNGDPAVRNEGVLVSQPIETEEFGEDTQCLVCKCAGQALHKGEVTLESGWELVFQHKCVLL